MNFRSPVLVHLVSALTEPSGQRLVPGEIQFFLIPLILKLSGSGWNLMFLQPLPLCARRMVVGDTEREFTHGCHRRSG